MPPFHAPVEDWRFVLHAVLGADELSTLPGYAEATPDLIDSVLAEAGKVAETVLHPLNAPGDRQGCTYENGVVRTPDGFPEAYRRFREGGWTGLTCDPAHGGSGLPHALGFAVEEMVSAANMSFQMYPGLSLGAYNCLAAFGSDWQKALFLPKLADGTWSGTMCLTEPQCGTDLGLIRTRAVPGDPDAEGRPTHRLTGTKIWISAGEHDLTENIVHLVLARLPDAPPGLRGISLFVVPKRLPIGCVSTDGASVGDGATGLGARNGVSCGGLEAKMGIHASATCVMHFDDATGWLVGEAHKGLRAMFVMMNAARLGVAMQGLGQSEAAYQAAVAHARDRRQGRSLAGAADPAAEADPILVHPDVRRTLLTIRAFNEGGRALAGWVALAIDRSLRHPDPAVRQEADDLVALMTPVLKAYFTDAGFENANRALQVLGGAGYTRDAGVEQLVRDARIAQVYEGTNGIQALDLVGRKLPKDTGRLLRRFFHPVDAFLRDQAADPAMAPMIGPLAKAFGKLQTATATLAQRGLRDPEEAAAVSTEYLRLFALVALGYMWARIARVCLDGAAASGGCDPVGLTDAGHGAAKLAVARFFFARMLPEADGLFKAVLSGKEPVMELADAAF